MGSVTLSSGIYRSGETPLPHRASFLKTAIFGALAWGFKTPFFEPIYAKTLFFSPLFRPDPDSPNPIARIARIGPPPKARSSPARPISTSQRAPRHPPSSMATQNGDSHVTVTRVSLAKLYFLGPFFGPIRTAQTPLRESAESRAAAWLGREPLSRLAPSPIKRIAHWPCFRGFNGLHRTARGIGCGRRPLWSFGALGETSLPRRGATVAYAREDRERQ
jgi:hypothetical protein